MEESEGNSLPSTLSVLIVNKFKNAFETRGMLKFTPELEGELKKCVDESFEGIQFSKPSSQAEVAGTAMPSLVPAAQATLRPLVFHFEYPGNDCVMAMMMNGKPEVVKNEKGSKSTPALARFADDKGFVYGTDAISSDDDDGSRPQKYWRTVGFWLDILYQPVQPVDLKEDGLVWLPCVFFVAYLIRKLKITAESQCVGGLCEVAILSVPMHIQSTQRLCLKEAVRFAGFKDAYVISAEGLAAYYWFHEKEAEIEKKNYSKEFVIIDLFGHAVLYKKSFEAGIDGKTETLVVKAILLLDLFPPTEKDKCRRMAKEILKTSQANALIPVIGRKERCPSTLDLASKCTINAAMVKDDESDEFKYFAAKGAALLSENPGNIGGQVQNMIGTTITIEPGQDIILPDVVLPRTLVKLTKIFIHDRTIYEISQRGIASQQPGRLETGYVLTSGIKRGTELKVTCELNWEGIWKVVEVSAKYSAEDGENYKAVKWSWLRGDANGENLSFSEFRGSSFKEDAKSLLLKLASLPSQPKGASSSGLGNSQDQAEGLSSTTSTGDQSGLQKKKWSTKPDASCPKIEVVKADSRKMNLRSTSHAKVASAKVPEVGSTTGDLDNSQDQAEGLGSSTISTGDRSGIQKKKRSTKIIRPNVMDVKTGLKKVLPSTSQLASAKLPVVGSTSGSLGNCQEDQAEGLGGSRTDSVLGNGVQKKKRLTKSKVIRPNDIIVNTGLKKIKLESDWVEPAVKIEQDTMDDFGEVGNANQEVNFEEEQEIEVEEAVVKIEVDDEEEEDIPDRRNEMKGEMVAKKRLLRNRRH